MRHTKYYLQSLRELEANETVAMNVNLPMNTPIMLVRVDGQMRLKRLPCSPAALKHIEPANPEQITLL